MSKEKVKALTDQQREIFEISFRTSGTSRMQCQCGKFYYNSNGQWDWEDGELEEYHADKESIDVDYTIGRLVFNNSEYADACNCWQDDAARVYHWLIAHRYSVVDFYCKVKESLEVEAERFPTVVQKQIPANVPSNDVGGD